MATTLVGRDLELLILRRLLGRVSAGGAAVVVIEGGAGLGKTSLLDAAAEMAAGTPEVEFTTLRTRCSEDRRVPYGIIDDLLPGLNAAVDRADGPPPSIAEIVSLGEPAGGAGPTPADAAAAWFRALAERTSDRCVLLLVDDAHFLDDDSCRVLSRVADAPLARTALVLAVRPERLEPACALAERLAAPDGSIRRHTLELAPLAAPACRQLLARWLEPTDAVVRRALDETGGEPFALVSWAQAERFGRPVPRTNDDPRHAVIRSRAAVLSDQQRRLLEIAAITQDFFLSTVVAAVAAADGGAKSVDVEEELLRASTTGLVRLGAAPRWVLDAGAELYEFEHSLVQQYFAALLPPGRRERRHRQVADALGQLLSTVPGTPVNLHPAILRHRRQGADWEEAAKQALRVARVFARRGAAAQWVAATCRAGRADLDHLPTTAATARRRAELIELELGATELRWGGQAADRVTQIESLCDEAIAAAALTADGALRARMTLMKGRVHLHTRGLDDALELLQAAYQQAKGGDLGTEFVAAVEYGRQLPKRDMKAGLDVLRAAYELQRSNVSLSRSADPMIIRARHLVGLQLGVNLLDDGQLGRALELLEPAVRGVRRERAGLLAIGTNYLAQALLAIGDVGRAEGLLSEAVGVALVAETAEAWTANNLALLGWLRAVYRHEEQGLEQLWEAWRQIRESWLANLVGLVGTLLVEALLVLHERDDGRLDEAERVLDTCIEESRRSAMTRSLVTAYILRSRLELLRDDVEAARRASAEAVRLLRDHGGRLPTIRAEVVFAQHALVLERIGELRGARLAAQEALDELRRRERTLPAGLREGWGAEVGNRLVWQAVEQLGVRGR